MTLFGSVAAFLDAEDIPFAVIGASALAVHGVARSTYDIDLLTTSPRALDRPLWTRLDVPGADVEVNEGDDSDPLRGVVRVRQAGQRDVDIIVGRHKWQTDALARGVRTRVLDQEVRVVTISDLIVLKLYAGGNQDIWDIEQLLSVADAAVRTDVDAAVHVLPRDSQLHWSQLTKRTS